MTTYESTRYKALGFYVGTEFRRFAGGLYHTDDPETMAVLDAINDVVRTAEEASEQKPEEPVKPTPKPRKAANTSAK